MLHLRSAPIVLVALGLSLVAVPSIQGRSPDTMALGVPGGWVLMPDHVTLIVSIPERGQLVYIDTLAEKEIKRVETDFQPAALALQGDTLFAAGKGSSVVYALDAKTGKSRKEFNLEEDAVVQLACHPGKGPLYASTAKYSIFSIDPESGAVTKTAAKGHFLAVDPVAGTSIYTGTQPPDRGGVQIRELSRGTFQIYRDRYGPRALLIKYTVDGKDLKFVSGQENAAVNGWDLHLTPDGKKIMLVGGGGWRPKSGGGPAGGYVIAVFSTSNLKTMLGQAPHGLNIAFHPVLNLGVVNHYGRELTVFNAKSLVKKDTIPVSKSEERRPLLLAFGGRGTKVVLWNGDNIKNDQGLHFVPLKLTDEDRAALARAYENR